MKSILSIHTNSFLVQIADGDTVAMAEIIFTLSEKTYQRSQESSEPDAPPVQPIEQFTTIRFACNASECSKTAALFREQGEMLHQLGETQGDAITLRGENKVLRDILAEAQTALEDMEANDGSGHSLRLIEIIKAARTSRA